MRELKHWHRFPKEMVDVPPLETFRVRSDGAHRILIELKISLITAGSMNT